MKNPDQSSLFVIASDLLQMQVPTVFVEISSASGSTPRDAGTFMLVTQDQEFGTIGGGKLEWITIEKARDFMAQTLERQAFEVSLGPEIGQCCGGKVAMTLEMLDAGRLAYMKEKKQSTHSLAVQIHGAGHTGHALSKALALLPLEVEIIDTRTNVFDGLPQSVKASYSPLPETFVRTAKPNTAFVIFTHEHHLDFLIAAEALKRGDAAYVGMIGSKTKRAVFKSWLETNGYEQHLSGKLVSPIGGKSVKDKRPEIIAALVTAELINIFFKKVTSKDQAL